MGRKTTILFLCVLVIVLLVTLPLLYIAINGAIAGSFDTFANDVGIKRAIYIFLAVILLVVDIFSTVGIVKLIKKTATKGKAIMSNANQEQIGLSFTKDEALVLFELVSRICENEDYNVTLFDDRVLFEDKAERQALWSIECQLQKILAEPFLPDYPEIIKQARDRIRWEDY
jgi:hypothetical protein